MTNSSVTMNALSFNSRSPVDRCITFHEQICSIAYCVTTLYNVIIATRSPFLLHSMLICIIIIVPLDIVTTPYQITGTTAITGTERYTRNVIVNSTTFQQPIIFPGVYGLVLIYRPNRPRDTYYLKHTAGVTDRIR